MSKKKGQKRPPFTGKPSTLRELFDLSEQDRKTFMEKVLKKANDRQKRVLEMASGSQVWFNECPEHEILVGTNTWDASKGEYVQENHTFTPPKGMINADGIHPR